MAKNGAISLGVCLSLPRQPNPFALPANKKNRSHYEVIASIVEATRFGGASPTSIMNTARLNHKQLKRYLGFLVKEGFVGLSNPQQNQVLCVPREKGLDFLRHYYAIEQMLVGGPTGKLWSWTER